MKRKINLLWSSVILIIICISSFAVYQGANYMHNLYEEKNFLDIKHIFLKVDSKVYSKIRHPNGVINISGRLLENKPSSIHFYYYESKPQIKIELSTKMLEHESFKKEYVDTFSNLQENLQKQDFKTTEYELLKDFSTHLEKVFEKYKS